MNVLHAYALTQVTMLRRSSRPRPGPARAKSGRGLFEACTGPTGRALLPGSFGTISEAYSERFFSPNRKNHRFCSQGSVFTKKPTGAAGVVIKRRPHVGVGGRGGGGQFGAQTRKKWFLRGSKNEAVFWSILCWFRVPFWGPKININQHEKRWKIGPVLGTLPEGPWIGIWWFFGSRMVGFGKPKVHQKWSR